MQGAVTFVWVLFVFAFATIGVQLFNGRFWYCSNSSGEAVNWGYDAGNSTIEIENNVRVISAVKQSQSIRRRAISNSHSH